MTCPTWSAFTNGRTFHRYPVALKEYACVRVVEMVVPRSGASHCGYTHGAFVDDGVDAAVGALDTVAAGVPVVAAEPDADAVTVGDDAGEPPTVSVADTDAVMDDVCDGVGDADGATHSVPGADGFAEQLT